MTKVRKCFSELFRVSSVHDSMDKGMVRELISNVKNGKAARQSRLMPGIEKSLGEVGVDIFTDLINQIIVKRANPIEWKLIPVVTCYNRKGYTLKKANYKALKLTDQTLEVANRVIKKLVSYQDMELQASFSS